MSQVIGDVQKELRTDIAIVGSGPGGSVTASVLAEVGGKDVLIVEAGPFLEQSSADLFSLKEMEQKYRNAGVTATMGSCKIAYVEGSCVGGGSEVNSGLYYRTPPDILELWQKQFEIRDFSEDIFAPHFEVCEKELNISALPISLQQHSFKLHEGAQTLGWDAFEVPRWMSFENDQWKRHSMTRTFLPKAMNAGARVLPQTSVLKITKHKEGYRLKALHTKDGQKKIVSIYANQVFVAGGAIHSPNLLRRSGLKKNIGNNLKLHPMVKVVAEFPENFNHLNMGVSAYQIREFAPRVTLGGSISTPPYLALVMLHHPEHFHRVISHWRSMALFYAQIVAGVGSVRPIPFFKDPFVNYKLTREDMMDLADSLAKLCKLLLTIGATAIYPTVKGHPVIRNEKDLALIPRPLPLHGTTLTSVHLMGTCPMGENRTLCAADSFGRIHDTKGLYIADGSLLGGALGVNPQGSVMAYARRNAMHFLGNQ
jgi:choline dehydrogenase-like flavoprotein